MVLATQIHDLSDDLPGTFDHKREITFDDLDAFDRLRRVADDLWEFVREKQVSDDLGGAT